MTIAAGEELETTTGKITSSDHTTVSGTLDIGAGETYEDQGGTTGVAITPEHVAVSLTFLIGNRIHQYLVQSYFD